MVCSLAIDCLFLILSMSYAGHIPHLTKAPIAIHKYAENTRNVLQTVNLERDIEHQDNPKLRHLANFLGYAGAIGSCYLYLPIIMNIVKIESSAGLSVSSWLFNAVGLTAAIIYPYRKRFPLSTYLDAGVLLAQVAAILALMAYFEQKLSFLLIGFALHASISSFFMSSIFPERYWGSIQVVAAVCCCYALVPQIIMNFRQGVVTFSPVTAAIGAIGNAVRLFNVYQLTKDPLVMTGSGIATVANVVIVLQYFYYNNPEISR